MEKTAEKKEIEFGTFLKDQIVDVKPVESSGKWTTLLTNGKEMKNVPYLFNKVKRSFQVPLNSERNGGGIKRILDDNNRVFIKKYINKYPDGMTEKEFFEEELGVDLNPSNKKEDNFWRVDKRGRVTLTKEGTVLNLRDSFDMLKYKILLSNTNLVAPNYEVRKDRQTYEFMIVDQGKITSQRIEEASNKAKAYTEYSRITGSVTEMKGFIKAIGRTIPVAHNEDWLKEEILNVFENDYKYFLNVINDPNYKKKIFIQNAVEAGAIKRMGDKRYVLDNGIELGDIVATIRYFSDPENQEVRMRVTSQIEMAKNR